MSRAFIAFHMGDYQKDTSRLSTLEHGAYFLLLQECWTHGRIPLEASERATIARMTLRDWLKIAPKINPYFQEDGTQKRATKEIEKAETISAKRSLAGFKGGINSGMAKSLRLGRDSKYGSKPPSKTEANAKQSTQQTPKQNGKQNQSPAKATKISKITTTTVEEDTAERLGNEAVDKPRLIASRELVAIMSRKR